MDQGVTTHQKTWQYIRELNAGDEQLHATAFINSGHKITYQEFFCEQERYARAFSGLGISEAAGSRVGVVGTKSVECIVAFFALNMMGVSVSFVAPEDLMAYKWLLKAVKTEGITDLVLPDTVTRPDGLKKIMKRRKKYGIRHVIVVRTSKRTPCPSKETKLRFQQNLRALCDIKGVRYMKDLLRSNSKTPIAYGSGTNDECAVIVHTSATTKSVHKPIPLSDVAINTTAARMLADERFAPLRRNATSMWNVYPVTSIAFINQVCCPLAFGATIFVYHGIMDVRISMDDYLTIGERKINVVFGGAQLVDFLYQHPKAKEIDCSNVKMVTFGGSPSSFDQKRRTWEFMHEHGGNPKIVEGYGNSECGAANIVTAYDDGDFSVDHGIGRPLAGVSVRVRDEQTGEFFSPADGEHEGVLYLSSESNSGGRIGDTVFFEPEVIDGKPYICTHDLVRVGESGDIFYLGRGNRFFVNNEGVKFDTGVVEVAIGDQTGIAECAIVPAYEKYLVQDTVPIIYVRVSKKGAKGNDVDIVRRALKNAYTQDENVAKNALPWMCVICKELPHNDAGKVDVMRIQAEDTPGRAYTVSGAWKDGKLSDVTLEKASHGTDVLSPAGIPNKMRKEKLKTMQAMIKTFAPDYLPQLLETMSLDGLGGSTGKEQNDERAGLSLPEPMNTILRFLFHASDVAFYYEK